MQPSPYFLKKAGRLANIIDEGAIGIAKELDTLESKIETVTEEIKATDRRVEDAFTTASEALIQAKEACKMEGAQGMQGEKGDTGDSYILTLKDKKDIANSITVPILEKVIEKTVEIVHEQPIVKTEIVKETTVDKSQTGEEIVNKVNDLPIDTDDFKIDASHIKNLPVHGKGHTGGVKALSNLVDVNVAGIQIGQTLQWNGTAWVAVTVSGSGFTKLTTASTIDDANRTFVFAQAPTYLVINGTWYDNTAGSDYTWTGTTTVTLNQPVGAPRGSIWGFI